MKKLIGAILISTLLVFAQPLTVTAGGVWSMVKNMGLQNRTPVSTFVLEVEGVNLRVYVFDVPEMKSVCVNVWGEDVQTLECKTYQEIGATPEQMEK